MIIKQRMPISEGRAKFSSLHPEKNNVVIFTRHNKDVSALVGMELLELIEELLEIVSDAGRLEILGEALKEIREGTFYDTLRELEKYE